MLSAENVKDPVIRERERRGLNFRIKKDEKGRISTSRATRSFSNLGLDRRAFGLLLSLFGSINQGPVGVRGFVLLGENWLFLLRWAFLPSFLLASSFSLSFWKEACRRQGPRSSNINFASKRAEEASAQSLNPRFYTMEAGEKAAATLYLVSNAKMG